jgi:hypothetical protein
VAYDLTRVGSKRFEHMSQALVLATLGPGVQVFGDGPDGGREATFDGDVDIETAGARWHGYGVVQAKYKERLDSMSLDQTWFEGQLRAELGKWLKSKARRRRPEYLLLTTNVRLSAVADRGGLDRVDDLFKEFADKGLTPKGYQVWHAEKIERLLESHTDVRTAYADLILPGDILTRLHSQLLEADQKLEDAWIGHASRALLAERAVALGESGDATNTPLALADIAVDLPAHFATDEKAGLEAMAELVSRADNVLAPNLHPAHKNRIVILGGPGQGKSTVGRLLCQIYRVAMLSTQDSARLTSEVVTAADMIRAKFDEGYLPTPRLSRLPFYVTITTYADSISGGTDISLIRHLTELINARASEHLGAGEVKRLLRAWPSIVVLDGLDEIASAAVRLEVASRIGDFAGEMATAQADVVIVCTSRPQAFGDILPPAEYDHLVLRRLNEPEALRYAGRFLSVRHAGNPGAQQTVRDRLRAAANDPITAKMLETPLQVTIMSLLLEQMVRAPSSRFELFNGYFNVIYARELNKPGWIGSMLSMQRQYVNALHEQAALRIHRNAESAGDAESVLTNDDLRALAFKLMTAEGYPADEAEEQAGRVVDFAAQRLVLLVPRGEGVGFEVRSLQEFMAARALTNGSDDVVPTNLAAIATSAHWRNTLLLASGRIFAERPALRGEVTSLIDRMDEQDWVHHFVSPGAHLALDAIDDAFAATAPNHEVSLVNAAMRITDGPPCPGIVRLVTVLRPRIDASQVVRQAVEFQARKRLAPGGAVSLGALVFLSGLVDSEPGSIAEWARLERTAVLARLDADSSQDFKTISKVALEYHTARGFTDGGGPLRRWPRTLSQGVARAARANGLAMPEQGATLGLATQLQRSAGSFDSAYTDDPMLLREVAAHYALSLPPADWAYAELVHETLSSAVEHDEVSDRLGMA